MFDEKFNKIIVMSNGITTKNINLNDNDNDCDDDILEDDNEFEQFNTSSLSSSNSNEFISNSKKRGRKKREVGTKKPFEEDWFPNWWLAFVEHGPLSNNPILGILYIHNKRIIYHIIYI